MMKVPWAVLRDFSNNKAKTIQCVEYADHYYIYTYDGPLGLCTVLRKDTPASSDQEEFESDYLPGESNVLVPTDSDNTPLARTKMTRTGYHFSLHGIELTTSTINSIHNTDLAGVDLGYSAIRFYSSNGTQLTSGTQLELTLSCVRTEIDWEPTHDIELKGAYIAQNLAPTSDIYLYIRAVPDVVKEYGGSVDFSTGGLNLKHLGSGLTELDGVTPKFMTYDAVNHTNKFTAVLHHGVGVQHSFQFLIKLYQAIGT